MTTSITRSDRWDDVAIGFELPTVALAVPYSRVASVMAATWDYFPGHHNPEYARGQGQPNIYLNTMFLAGLLDRAVTDWAGPAAFIRSRRLDMIRSVCAGDDITVVGRVDGKPIDDDGHRIVTVEISINTRNGVCSRGLIGFTWDPVPRWAEPPVPATIEEEGAR